MPGLATSQQIVFGKKERKTQHNGNIKEKGSTFVSKICFLFPFLLSSSVFTHFTHAREKTGPGLLSFPFLSFSAEALFCVCLGDLSVPEGRDKRHEGIVKA